MLSGLLNCARYDKQNTGKYTADSNRLLERRLHQPSIGFYTRPPMMSDDRRAPVFCPVRPLTSSLSSPPSSARRCLAARGLHVCALHSHGAALCRALARTEHFKSSRKSGSRPGREYGRAIPLKRHEKGDQTKVLDGQRLACRVIYARDQRPQWQRITAEKRVDRGASQFMEVRTIAEPVLS